MWCHVQSRQLSWDTHLLLLDPDTEVLVLHECYTESTEVSFPEVRISQLTSWLSLKPLILGLETGLMQLWTLRNAVCVCCGNRCVKILSLCTEHFHLEFSKLTSDMKELVLNLPGIKWVSDGGWLQLKLWEWKAYEKKTDYNAVTVLLVLQSFTSDGVKWVNIDGTNRGTGIKPDVAL